MTGTSISAYVHEEDGTCEYLEVNEVIESTEFQNWTPRQRSNITDSDLGGADGSRHLTCYRKQV